MSVHESVATPDHAGQADVLQFATVMRGYDRGQVDDYVARLNDFLADAERRADRAERTLTDLTRRNERLSEELRQAIERRPEPSPGRPYDGLGERIESMLRLAAEEAESVRQQGHDQAEEMIDAARRRRENEVAEAERELRGVGERRDAVVAELRKVQDVLATLGLRSAVAGDVEPVAAVDLPDTGEIAPPDGADDAETRVIQLSPVPATTG